MMKAVRETGQLFYGQLAERESLLCSKGWSPQSVRGKIASAGFSIYNYHGT